MRRRAMSWLAGASLGLVLKSVADPFADTVVGYNPGSGFQPGYTNAATVLGDRSVITEDPTLGNSAVDPFSPPYLATQLLSVGAGGSVTVRFNSPIQNDAAHPFGLDFIIFGSSGFIITNGDFTGGGITDGTLFGANPGDTRVWISADNATFFQLDPALAPVVDTVHPTDGAGNPQQPVNPSLTAADFAGKNLAGIRSLYGGSAGGAGYDISWARDGNGQPVFLPQVSYVRVDVLAGRSEIDAFSAVPEPGVWTLALMGGLTLVVGHRRRNSR